MAGSSPRVLEPLLHDMHRDGCELYRSGPRRSRWTTSALSVAVPGLISSRTCVGSGLSTQAPVHGSGWKRRFRARRRVRVHGRVATWLSRSGEDAGFSKAFERGLRELERTRPRTRRASCGTRACGEVHGVVGEARARAGPSGAVLPDASCCGQQRLGFVYVDNSAAEETHRERVAGLHGPRQRRLRAAARRPRRSWEAAHEVIVIAGPRDRHGGRC